MSQLTDLEALNLLIATADKVTSARLDYLQQTLGLNKLFLSEEFNQLKQGLRYLRDSGGIQSIQEGENITIDNTDPLNPVINASGEINPQDYDLSEFLNASADPFVRKNSLKNRILHFPLTATITGSTSWYTLRSEAGTVYNPLLIASGYNNVSNVITEPRVCKHRIPYNCAIKNIRWIYSTLTTPFVVRLIYFKHNSGSVSSSYDNYIVAEHTFPNSGNANAKDEVFSTIDTEFVAEAGGFLTLVFNNNNISTGNLRSTLFEVEIQKI
jgi:hypothetical protein